jgi:hypothetical protein
MAWAQAEREDAAPASPPPPAEAASGEFSDLYRIGVDDRLQVSVWRNPELSVTVPVRPDGRISVPLVGDVMAGGRAPQEVAADIEKQLATYVRDPKVAVILVDLRSHEFISRVRVTGAVRGTTRALHRLFAKVLRMTTKGALINRAVFVTIERHAEVLKLNDGFRRLAAHELNRILITEPVRALHRVIHVPVPVVLAHIAE